MTKKTKQLFVPYMVAAASATRSFRLLSRYQPQGNIEDWLTTLLHYMQLTVKALCATAGEYCAATGV